MFAILLLPLLGFIGLAIDWGFTTRAKAQLDLAADATALVGATTAARVFNNNGTTFLADGKTAGLNWFNAQAGVIAGVNMSAPTLVITRSGGIFTASLAYNATIKTTLAKLFGFSTFPVAGVATATIAVGGYSDIEILMDVSSSMGIAATPAGMAQLGALALKSPLKSWAQNQACGFGCHWDAGNNDFYGLARKNNIALRIDILNTTVQNVIAQLITLNNNALYRIGLYTFDATFHSIYPLSANLAGALATQKSVVVPLADPNNEPDTNFPLAMSTLAGLTSQAGDGSTAASPRKFVFFVTDGIQDYMKGNARILGLMDPANCNALKAKGATILVLYTQYVPIPTNAFYNANVAPIAAKIVPSLTSCASTPQYFFLATDPASIQAAMTQMLQIATSAQGRFVH